MTILSISAAPYDGHPLETTLESLARCGATHVEPAYIVGYTDPFDEETFRPQNARQYKSQLDATGLQCHAFSSHIDLGREDAIEVFTRRMDFAAHLGAKIINTNAARRDRETRFLHNIEPLAAHAAALGLTIGLENPGNGEDNLMNDATEALALIARLALPTVRLNYDPGNTVSHRPNQIDPTADSLLALPGCAHFHLKDVRHTPEGWHFTVPGQGDLDCPPILAALHAANLPYAIELPLRMHRRRDAQPVRAPNPISLLQIEEAIRACLNYVGRMQSASSGTARTP